MIRNHTILTWALWLLVPWILGCSDDDDSPTEPPPHSSDMPWPEETLTGVAEPGGFLSMRVSATRALAAGAAGAFGVSRVGSFTPILASRNESGTWTEETAPLPAIGALTKVGFASGGDALVAGVDIETFAGFILDERDGWSRHDVDLGATAFAENGGTARFGGTGTVQLLVSTEADVWTPESLPFPETTNERGVQDLDARAGTWAACGFDDGGNGTPESPNAVVFWHDGGGWQRVDAPCGGCSRFEFRAVAISESGGLYLGGTVTDFGGDSDDEYTAYLVHRSPDGLWTEIVLPDAGALDRVNDILVTDDGDMYLACGMRSVTILRTAPGEAPAIDMTLSSARIQELAAGPGGEVWGAGSVIVDGADRFAIWKR